MRPSLASLESREAPSGLHLPELKHDLKADVRRLDGVKDRLHDLREHHEHPLAGAFAFAVGADLAADLLAHRIETR
jgi:hypothetical protein